MREYLLVLLIAAGTTYLVAGLCRRLAFRFNAVAIVRDRDVHTRPIPYFGGVAMLAGFAVAFLVATQLPWLGQFDAVRHDARAVFLAGLVICSVGVLDDMFELNALAKIAGQMLAAGIAVLNGVKVYWIPLPDAIISLDDGMSIVVTMVLIFLCVNAINLIDGLDGLAAGVVAIGAGAFFSFAYLLSYEQELVRATPASLVTVVAVGVCLGFLPYNVHPARMFMGDSGAMLLGFMLAISMISLTGQLDPSQVNAGGSGLLINAYLPLILPVAVMLLPLGDLVLAYVRRTMAGKLWYQADKQHLHHRMLQLGHSHPRAVYLLWLWTGVFAGGAVLIGITGEAWATAVTAGAALVAAVLTWAPLRRGTAFMAEVSPARERARKLFAGGATIGHAVALIVVPVLWFVRGDAGGLSALISALAVLAFLGLGQAVQTLLADSPTRTLFIATMASYALRVSVPVIILIIAQQSPEGLVGVDRPAVAIATIAVTGGWLAGELWTFSRLRIPVFDDPSEPAP